MKCAYEYYKEALQVFYHILLCAVDTDRAKQLMKENEIDLLEKEIMIFKENMSYKQFYFQAGIVKGHLLSNECTSCNNSNLKECFEQV